jgi:hypothetical protein
MPAPTQADFKIAEAQQLADGVIVSLRAVGWGHTRDLAPLRERLQQFANLVMETAHGLVDDAVER